METNKTPEQQPRPGRGKLIFQFLKGSKAFFIICMVCAAVSALADMITPQIIRVTVDNILGSSPVDPGPGCRGGRSGQSRGPVRVPRHQRPRRRNAGQEYAGYAV